MATTITRYDSVSTTNDITITLASLANSSSFLAGRESTIVDNTSNKYMQVRVRGQITTGTTPTANTGIQVWVYGELDANAGTFVLPVAGASALTGADAAATFDAEQRNQLKLASFAIVNGTSNRAYAFDFEVSSLFGGVMPLKWGLWVSNGSGSALNATSGNHWFTYTGVTYDTN